MYVGITRPDKLVLSTRLVLPGQHQASGVALLGRDRRY
jgi:hypothetical protein